MRLGLFVQCRVFVNPPRFILSKFIGVNHMPILLKHIFIAIITM